MGNIPNQTWIYEGLCNKKQSYRTDVSLMAMEENKYYQMAIEWAEKYLSEHKEISQIKIKLGETIIDDYRYVDVNKDRLAHGGVREKRMAYLRIKQLKDFLIKCKPIVDKII